ncbi:MAG: DUF309 domain-containing protein [Acidobacteria bacterium]|nr:DUF309 domain-containing protein [Acidobacteriota bacterium]
MSDIWDAGYRQFRNTLAGLTVPVFSDVAAHVLWPVALSRIEVDPIPIASLLTGAQEDLRRLFGIHRGVTPADLWSLEQFAALSAGVDERGDPVADPAAASKVGLSRLAAPHVEEMRTTLSRVLSAASEILNGPALPEQFNEQLRRAVVLFRRDLFFECHEYLEAIWIVEEGARKGFLQGLIQLSVGFHHDANGNIEGAVALLQRGIARIENAPEGLVVPEINRLLDQARMRLANLR